VNRTLTLYLRDILEAIERIERYIEGCSFDEFSKNTLVVDAVVRNFEIIGEAAKHIPAEIKQQSFNQMERYGGNAGQVSP